MHDDFADWYRVAVIDLAGIDLNARWDGIDGFAKQATGNDLLDATRLFYGVPPKDHEFLRRFRAPLKLADDKFSMLDNNAELRVLAGAFLASCFAMGDGRGVTAALALTVGSFQGRRTPAVADVVRLAREHLTSHSKLLRSQATAEVPPTDFATVQQALRQAFQNNGPLQTAAEPVANAFQSLAKAIIGLAKWATDQNGQRALLREESDVLWWLFAGRSRDLKIPFPELKPPAICIVAANELADLATTIPGPYAANAFLDKAIRDAGLDGSVPVSLAEAIAACPAEWRKTIAGRPAIDAVEDLCPVSFALRKAVESDGKRSWQSVFQGNTGLRPTEKMKPLELAEQGYEEQLLARSIAALKD